MIELKTIQLLCSKFEKQTNNNDGCLNTVLQNFTRIISNIHKLIKK